MPKVIGARDEESMSIPYILQCTIQYNALCHVIKFFICLLRGFHALNFPEFRATEAE